MATAFEPKHTKPNAREVFSFTLILAGFEEITSELENAIYEAGCSDALLGIHAGTPYLGFDREAETLDGAIKSAIRDVERASSMSGIPVEAVRVIPPGADTIENFNAYLRLRRQFAQGLPRELAERMEQVLAALLEHDPEELRRMLSK
jgi:hypothetical protein